jgi:serralysin
MLKHAPLLGCGCPDCLAARLQSDLPPDPRLVADKAFAATTTSTAVSAGASTYYIDALLPSGNPQWPLVNGVATVTYSFLTSVPGYYSGNADERNHFAAMSAAAQQVVRDVLGMYSEVAHINFVEVASGQGTINFGTADLGSGIAGWAYYPGSTASNSVDGDVWITNRYSEYSNPVAGTWAYQTFIHEIGHALGLKHPGNYNAGGGGTEGPYLPGSEDNHQYTVMSYYSGPTYNGVEPRTPQLYDIAAIQYLYGANYATRSGNDTYTFPTTTVVRTIWDGGGTDTIDCSNQTAAVRICLEPGSFSSIAGVNNIAIAYGCTIENAIGGSGKDLLQGNGANNVLTGGRGLDSYVFSITGGWGSDEVFDIDGLGNVVFGAVSNVSLLLQQFTGVVSGNNYILTYQPTGSQITFDGITSVANWQFYYTTSAIVSFSGWTAIPLLTLLIPQPVNLVGDNSPNTLTGGNADDTLYGIGGDDTLIGLASNDYLDGGPGADIMKGGPGNDAYVVDNPGDQVIEKANEGTDLVLSSINYALPKNVENLTLTGTNPLAGTGNSLANVITANDAGCILNGGAGDDTLIGGAGNDTFVISGKNDTWDSFDGGAGVNTIKVAGTGNVVLAGFDAAASHIQAWLGNGQGVKGTAGSDVFDFRGLTSVSGIKFVDSGDGNDILYAVDDGMTLRGGAGNDTLVSGHGNDVLTGGTGQDTFVFGAGLGLDRITDFKPGIASDHDIIQFDAALFPDFASVMAHAAQVGANVVITHDAANTLTLQNVTLAKLVAADFLFV